MSMKKFFIILILLVSLPVVVKAQKYSLRTNLLGLATTNLNLEAGLAVGRQWSVHVPVTYNPFVLSTDKRFQNLTVEPGARYWFLETFSQSFIGFQALYSRFHVGGLTNDYRYDGSGVGVGISYGYSRVLKNRWNIEFEAGLGVFGADYDKYRCKECGEWLGKEKKVFLIPSKVSVALVYLF